MAHPEYTWLAADLRTNIILAELPIRGASVTNVLSDVGDFQGSVKVGDRRLEKVDLHAATLPGRTALYLDRNGVIVWGGIIWRRRYDATSSRLNLVGNTFESYAHKRLLGKSLRYIDTDMLEIARQLYIEMQAVSGGNIGILTPPAASGQLKTRRYRWQETPIFGEMLENLANNEPGFDYNVDVFYNTDGVITKNLMLGYPQIGQPTRNTNIVFEYPGTITHFDDDEDAVDGCNEFIAMGADDTRRAIASNPRSIDSGYPLLQKSLSLSTASRDRLEAHAREELAVRALPLQTIDNLKLDPAKVTIGDFRPGDGARLELNTPYHGKTTLRFRIASLTLRPADPDSQDVLEVALMRP